MRAMRSLIAVAAAVVVGACSAASQDPVKSSDGEATDVATDTSDPGDVDEPDEGGDDDAAECAFDEDCVQNGGCLVSANCVDGACVLDVVAAGTPCAIGCSDGVCQAGGVCGDLTPRECPEVDSNTCTIPTCVVAAGAGAEDSPGECIEKVIEDGEPPYASSECFEGAVCVGGQVDSTDGAPTALAQECAAMGADLDPFGCVDHYICVGGDEQCRPVVKPDGTQCWGDDEGAGSTCAGQACVEGECVPEGAFDVACTDDEFPDDCDDGCRQCTELACHWIDDPAAVGDATKKVRYCQPAATPGAACLAADCKVDQACGLGGQADGPLGKETLGACVGGDDKTAAQCLEEAGKPALECLLAGTNCVEGTGCQFDQNVMDQWCWPPEGLCWEKDETFCTHLDAGALWDAETGCHTAWVELDCDDANECTVGQCKPQLSDFVCDFTLLSGAACDDGDDCTVGEACDTGECQGATPLCDDGDPCNGQQTCTDGVCGDVVPLECDDGDVCTTDSCDPATGCLYENNDAPCDDGDSCTLASVCSDGECVFTQINSCDDGNPCTENQCDSNTVGGCLNPVVPSGTPCPGGQCIKEVCTCTPQCDGTTCGDDGCGGTCECAPGVDCVAGVCGGDDLSGNYWITASPSTANCSGLPCSFVPFQLQMTFTETTVDGIAPNTPVGTLVYDGTRNGNDFLMTGQWTYAGLLGTEVHSETWDCTFTGPGQFSGTMVDVYDLYGLFLGSVTWNITGVKQ